MAYSSEAEAQAAMDRAFEAMKLQHPGKVINGKQYYNVPWSAQQAFNDKWFPIVQQAGHVEVKANPNPASQYAKMSAAEQKAIDDRKAAAAAEAYANPSFADPGPPVSTPQAGAAQAGAAGPQGMTANEYEYQKAIDLANISAQSGERIATIGKESALGVAGIQKESALGVANIDKQIKQMQLESAENIAKLSNINKSALANIATNQSILTGLVNAFNF